MSEEEFNLKFVGVALLTNIGDLRLDVWETVVV